jgi:hypothetical protein
MFIRRVAVSFGAMVVATAVFAPAARASQGETATHGAAQRVVSSAVRGGTPAGVPGRARPGSALASSNGISYHGGPVMTAGVNAYIIWYGNWSGDSATTILPKLLTGLSGSPYYRINTTYHNGLNQIVPNLVKFSGSTTDAYSQGKTNLSDGQINSIVSSAISSGRLPKDSNGVYFVLTSVDVTKSGFLTQYCGWHTSATIAGATIKYAFVGDPGANPACSVQTSVSPNGNVGADAMASIVSHELEESATDPNLNAWYDRRGYENADKCAWTFGSTYSVPNGSKANMSLDGLNFLIQRNWVNGAGGYCSLSY